MRPLRLTRVSLPVNKTSQIGRHLGHLAAAAGKSLRTLTLEIERLGKSHVEPCTVQLNLT